MNVRCARSIFIISLVTGFASAAFAQAGRGSISGLITDPTGAIVPGAKVVAQSHATGLKLSTVSTGAGLYSFVSLAPGSYEVTVRNLRMEWRPGYRSLGFWQKHLKYLKIRRC